MKEYYITIVDRHDMFHTKDCHLSFKEDGKYIVKDSSTYYIKNNKPHRDDGPACEWINGDYVWYNNGKIHRLDGPANSFDNGTIADYYVNDRRYFSKESYEQAVYLYKNNLHNYM